MTDRLTTSLGDAVTFDRHVPDPDVRLAVPPVIFVAGAGPYRATDRVTTATAELLAAGGVESTVHDRIGRGESRGATDGPVSLDRELAAIGALIAEVGGKAVLVGHSSGCSIALRAAAERLGVAGLVLWEAPLAAPGEEAEVAPWIAEVERLVRAGELEAAMWHYMKDMPPEFREFAKQDPNFGTAVAQAGAYVADGESLVWAASAPLPQLMADVAVPVLAVVGTETFPGMPEAADRIAAELPNATSERVAGAMHSWDPAAMSERIATFVTGLD